MPNGAITIGIEKITWYSKLMVLLPIILKIFVVVVFILLLYFLYNLLKKKRTEKELIRAAEQISEKRFFKKRKKKKIIPKTQAVELPAKEAKQGLEEETTFEIPAGIEKHLKENERTVINILKQRNGQAEQGTLRVVSGFPKASLSRILKELEDRNIIYKEKKGKKNIVFLRK